MIKHFGKKNWLDSFSLHKQVKKQAIHLAFSLSSFQDVNNEKLEVGIWTPNQVEISPEDFIINRFFG